ncbi:MAG: hypothetical protein ACXWUH_18825, partial [Burkholderiales bacterium]
MPTTSAPANCRDAARTEQHGLEAAPSPSKRSARGRREREAQASAAFEDLLTRISTVFAGARWDRVNAEVDLALADMLVSCGVEQASLFEVLSDNTAAYLRHVARSADMPASPEQFSYGEWFPWAFRKVVLAG